MRIFEHCEIKIFTQTETDASSDTIAILVQRNVIGNKIFDKIENCCCSLPSKCFNKFPIFIRQSLKTWFVLFFVKMSE